MPREITKELIRKAYNGASIISFYQAAIKYMSFLQDNACRYIMLDTEKNHTGLHWYTAETLKKAGIMIQ